MHSMVSNGCEIEGTVRNSVIGRGVVIKKGAVVEDSVILPGVIIGEDVCIRCAVVDKGGTMRLGSYPCKIKPGTMMAKCYQKELIGEPDHPLYIKRGDRI